MPEHASNNSANNRPTVCRSCGAIVGGGQRECAVCGAAAGGGAPAQTRRPIADGETIRFARAVLDRPQKFTIILLMANLFVFLLMWQSSGLTTTALWEFPQQVLLAYGAKLNVLINNDHQWWRFITPMFVHINLPHLLVNMYSLWMVGPYVEKLYGSARFITFWVLTGIAGVVASYLTVRPNSAVGSVGRFLFKSSDVPSAGASGALFGLVGVLFVFGIKYRHELPEGFKRAFGTGMLPIIFINLFIGYLGRGFIDNAAHIGGLVSGAILALAVNYRRPGESGGVAIAWQVVQVACIALVALGFIMAYRHPTPPSLMQQQVQLNEEQIVKFDSYTKFVSYVGAMNDAQETLNLALKDHDVSKLDATLKSLDAAPHLDATADDLRARLKTLINDVKGINTAPTDSAKPDVKNIAEKQSAVTTAFRDLIKDYNGWLKTEGRTYSGLNEATGEPR